MKFTTYKNPTPGKWHVWFALWPTIVHKNEQWTEKVWLECYHWRRNSKGRIERKDCYGNADPYEVLSSSNCMVP